MLSCLCIFSPDVYGPNLTDVLMSATIIFIAFILSHYFHSSKQIRSKWCFRMTVNTSMRTMMSLLQGRNFRLPFFEWRVCRHQDQRYLGSLSWQKLFETTKCNKRLLRIKLFYFFHFFVKFK